MRLLDFFRKLGNATPEQTAASTSQDLSSSPVDSDKQEGVVQSVWLHFHENNSDKVYHLELRQIDHISYTVYFEYGRRGNALQSGTKTPDPVSLEAAEKIFNALLNEKTKKGYAVTDAPSGSPKRSFAKKNLQARNKAIIGHLELAARAPQKQMGKNWSLSRVVWRAGVLVLPEALPHLAAILQLKTSENPALLRYCTLWSIARCAQKATEAQKDSVKPALTTLLEAEQDAFLYLVCTKVFQNHETRIWREALALKLPPSFQHQLKQQQAALLQLTLQDYVENRQKSNFSFVEVLYALSKDAPSARQAIIWFVENAPFQAGYFKVLRHLYKMSEMLFDAEIFGILTKRFCDEPRQFVASSHDVYMELEGKWQSVNTKQELAKEDSRLAYSNKTRNWFIQRTFQTLLDTLTLEDHTFVKMAVGVLLAFDDSQKPSTEQSKSRYLYNSAKGTWDVKEILFPAFSEYPAFFYLLFGGNDIFKLSNSDTRWSVNGKNTIAQFKKQDKSKHFEPHTNLWDACPQAYIHLLAESNANLVQAFALRRFEAHAEKTALIERFDNPLLLKMMVKKYHPTALFALQIAESRVSASVPDRDLVLAMLEAPHLEVQKKALEWMKSNLSFFVQDSQFVFQLLIHEQTDLRQEAYTAMPQILDILNETQQQVLVGRMIAWLLALPSEKTTNNKAETAENDPINTYLIAHELITHAKGWGAERLLQLSRSILQQLLQHPVELVAVFGAELIKQRPLTLDQFSDLQLQALLSSKFTGVRKHGMDIMNAYALSDLLDRKAIITQNLDHTQVEIRENMRANALRAMVEAPEFGQQVLGTCINILLKKENTENVHEETLSFVTNYLKTYLSYIDRKIVFKLLNANYIPANTLAAFLVEHFVTAESLSVRNIVRLGEHEVLAVRQVCWQMFQDNIPRMRYESADALRLLECEWEDTREFGFAYFEQNYGSMEWNLEMMVAVMDSERADVHSFGKKIVEKYLQPEDGAAFLLQLIQHPRPEIQAFAAQFLEKYALGQPDALEKLNFYCATVLLQVNKARKAKDMVYSFLKEEAMSSERSATTVAHILNKVSLTTVAEDKAKYIELMRDLNGKYPSIFLDGFSPPSATIQIN
jgi:predicted DNA-binding WGR domain protein